MLDASARNEFDVVVIHHTDRLARGEPLIIIMESLTYHGVLLESTQQNIEDTDEGKVILHFLSFSSKQELKRIVKRTSDGRHAAVAQHQILGGTPSYGYAWNADHTCYVLNHTVFYTDSEGVAWTEFNIVLYLFDQVKKGIPLSSIGKSLQAKGIPTRKGMTFWHPATLSHILRNPNYWAIYCFP